MTARTSSMLDIDADCPPSPTLNLVGLNRYIKLEKLGEGNYGLVYKARDKISNNIVALKKIKLDDEDDGVPATAIREIAILQEIRHPYVVDLLDVIFENDKLYLSFEFLDLNLRQYIDSIDTKHLTLPLIKLYIWKLLVGMEFCHSRRILHRDLKPQNILVDHKGRLKIADFGLARAVGQPCPPVTHEVATLWYRAPEILLGSKMYSAPVDIWAIGTILIELATRKAAFPGDSEIDTLFKIFRLLGTPSEDIWPGCSSLPDFHFTFPQWARQDLASLPEYSVLDEHGIDLIYRCMTYDPSKRISARQALQHPWFRDFDEEQSMKLALKVAKKVNANCIAKKSKLQRRQHDQDVENASQSSNDESEDEQ